MSKPASKPKKSRLRKIARRTFLIGTGAVAGGLAVGYYFYQREHPNPLLADLDDGEVSFNHYVTVAPDNTITIIVPRAEMGQGVSTTLAALVAEELDVGLEDIVVEHGPASPAYMNQAMLIESAPFPTFDRSFSAEGMRSVMEVISKFLALQATGGSSATIDAFEKMRHAGCAAREVLKQAAAEKFGVPASTLVTENATVTDPASGKSATYGELAAAAAGKTPPADMELRGRSEWKLLGKSQPRTDVRKKATGAPIYGVDVDLPDMLYATVRMNPRLGGAVNSIDASDAEKMKGVVKVVPIESQTGNGFGVIADNSWRAFQAAEAVKADWGPAPYPADTDGITAKLKEALDGGEYSSLREAGDVVTAFADAPSDNLIEAEYQVPFLAHACMEPMNATAWFRDGKLDVWAPNQAPTILQDICASTAGIDSDQVNIHTTFLGGGFGRRGEVDFPIYATKLAMAAEGRPVKVTWTREEDTTHDTYRPGAVSRYRAVLDNAGNPKALHATVAAPSIMASLLGRTYPSLPAGGPDKTIIEGAYDQPYDIDNYRIDAAKADLSIPVGFWRSVGNSFNPFMQESFLDEIAAKSGKDPLALRLELASSWPTATGVLQRVGDMAHWGEPMPENRAQGVAFALSFGTWVAQIVQVKDEDGSIRIEKVWCVADPGEVLDPEIFKAQMMSGIVFGLSSAVGQEITFSDGMVEQSNFHDYDAIRMNQCPDIEVEVLENAAHMGGAGEPGTPPSIPALANAVFALTGKRIRKLPLSNEVDFV
ncbi:molybdopterin cofactor-binding domain-containing protein [Hoeflea sp. TYP-13]|uniref:xanthine dehydrogenase family protein molybdopterin-binding subunit n=1 Tax=Hoeflea sp. TYP-13 TaxID=3230023 RepID=UPI0034C6B00E